MSLIRKLHDLCDVVINVGNRKIYAHKVGGHIWNGLRIHNIHVGKSYDIAF